MWAMAVFLGVGGCGHLIAAALPDAPQTVIAQSPP